ncbi:hypothetical protein FGG08_005643 [Glutinoglossum americanum]|uniref:Uncharacterized protein n=1 Tax=Glutinoglossum americanum TaxID=1670608 RepID=A0A9P8I536_9PEZI|nr:hypothetical protein FGG08_005643 [Glutinoglossum americanum]
MPASTGRSNKLAWFLPVAEWMTVIRDAVVVGRTREKTRVVGLPKKKEEQIGTVAVVEAVVGIRIEEVEEVGGVEATVDAEVTADAEVIVDAEVIAVAADMETVAVVGVEIVGAAVERAEAADAVDMMAAEAVEI